ncbi:MAG: glycoside hydrolase family 25 protein, partial [Prevotellaceae bacterium]|nr:glycoside hydrolase family 25 protein [Prevotellaceae bacterium]
MKRLFYIALFAFVVFLFAWYALLDNRPVAYGIRIPKGYVVHGVDLSRWQGKVNWQVLEKMRSGEDSIRITFAFIKATEGRSLTDSEFENNWREAAKTSIIRGAYHYFIPSRDAGEQADNFIKNVKLSKGDLPPVLDVEKIGKKSATELRKNIKIWLKAVEKHYGIKPIIYTYIDFYEKYLRDGGLDEYPLWIAHYHRKSLNV